jgi:hypothetical protein
MLDALDRPLMRPVESDTDRTRNLVSRSWLTDDSRESLYAAPLASVRMTWLRVISSASTTLT